MSIIDSLLGGLDSLFEDEVKENNETTEISEVDELRKDQVAEIMGEVFTEDVIENWDNLSIEEKTALLNQYYHLAGETLGISVNDVIVEDLQAQFGEGTMGYNNGDGNVHVDVSRLTDSSQLGDLLNTVTHEMRHQLQTEAVARPEDFSDIPSDVLEQWKYELNPNNYIRPEYDYEGYYNQAIEVDARDFGESVVDRFIESMT